MAGVYSTPGPSESFPWHVFLRASTLHVGAAAAAASLRSDLVDGRRVDAATFNDAYAVARLTPGTTLLALFALLGYRVQGLRGATSALLVGTAVPAVFAVCLAAVYVAQASHPLVVRAMQGARVGGLAVFVWAVVRLIRPPLEEQGPRGVALGVAVLSVSLAGWLPPFVVLLVGGILAGALFRTAL